MVARADRQGIKTLYLLTTTAEGFFLKRGFLRIEREGVPAEIRSTEEFKSLCLATALCMARQIDPLSEGASTDGSFVSRSKA
jgi:amino-acid N-acetyltransferase